ncbi:Trm112 family protein [Orbus sturtevantii]|uniref:Trm112 family protein n=1 Tax=Orbus sturtevantii TaxID=3074109 RepID=UPI00370D1524
MKEKLLSSIACPKCFGELDYNEHAQNLTCRKDGLIYDINDGIPTLLVNKAKPLELEEQA